MKKNNKIISQEERLLTIHALDKSIAKIKFWKNDNGSVWFNRFNRFKHYHYKYLLFLLSRVCPFTISVKTFFNSRLFFRLPEHYYFLISGFFPEIDQTHEGNLTKFLIKNLRRGDIFFDVGANCGFYTVLARFFVGEEGQVHAFEPGKLAFDLLKKNKEDFENVYVNDVAIYNKKGYINFYLNRFSVENTIKVRRGYNLENYKKTIVKTITIDDYCRGRSIIPTFIKIDVEGSEGDVITGAQKILELNNPIIAMEIWKKDNQSHRNAFQLLIKLGYKPYFINQYGDLDLVYSDNISLEACLRDKGPQVYENLIFKK